MDAKITLTTGCNAKCATCPVWRTEARHMQVHEWARIWEKLNASAAIHKILLNNTGDVWNHPEADAILAVLGSGKVKWTVMTTNAGKMQYIPDGIDELIISFNGGTKQGYERTTGLPFEEVVENIRSLYPQMHKVKDLQMHCLMWDGNEGEEDDLLKLWSDFPGKIRVSYKYDNQQHADHTIEEYKTEQRIPCDYIYNMLCIYPGGEVWMCAHDFHGENKWGNVLTDSIDEVIMNVGRVNKLQEHIEKKYTGLCEKCNYNRPQDAELFRYIKGARCA